MHLSAVCFNFAQHNNEQTLHTLGNTGLKTTQFGLGKRACSVLIGSDCILQGGWGQGAEKNRAIKRFRNRASSNHDFISISINCTALLSTHIVLLDTLTVIYTHYTQYVHILHYAHIYTHTIIYEGVTDYT